MSTPSRPQAGLVLGVCLALLAFAGNSVLCRLALRPTAGTPGMSPAAFTSLRIVAGAIVLIAFVHARRPAAPQSAQPGFLPAAGSWRSALALLVYAAAFSWAYQVLDAGAGALVLFGAVQLTMLAAAMRGGEQLSAWQAGGGLVAAVGLGVLLWPSAASTAAPVAPVTLGPAFAMAISGIAWGVYTLRGRHAASAGAPSHAGPTAHTAGNFARAALLAVPLGLLWTAWTVAPAKLDARGVALAISAGALTSGAGYAVWYAVLPALSRTRAALLQLLVPVLAAILGIALLGEALSPRLLAASALVLTGVAATLVHPRAP